MNKIINKINKVAVKTATSQDFQRAKKIANILIPVVMIVGMSAMIFASGTGSGGIANAKSVFDNLFKQVYKAIIGISTITAFMICGVCLLIRMISKNQRSVDEANQWIKRVLITWVILNGLVLFYGIANDVSSGMGGAGFGADDEKVDPTSAG